MRHFLTFIVFSCISLFSQAQGEYFQQEVNYTIDVTLDDKGHILRGFESFEYINNSNTTLNHIYIHLWPNAYKNGSTALAKQLLRDNNYKLYNAPEKDRGYIDSIDFKINGTKAKWELDPVNIDICKLTLNEPLPPGSKITVSTPFKVKLPSGRISRLGHIGESYQITQWYPKPAVYDKDGWHPMPYLNQGEFYSEFGSFDVNITLPENYVLGATGDRVNAAKEEKFIADKIKFTETYLKNPKDAQYQELNKNTFPASSKNMKTISFHQEKVHDFAWFADKRYLVLKGEVELPFSKRKVDTYAMFTTNEADLWANSIEYLNDATYYYSLWTGEYAYNHVTAVDGTISAGGGMEYPNITVIGKSGTALSLEVVIMHEVGHNWFYGMLGSNERIHAWLDEGLNSFTESRYMDTKYPEMSAFSMMVGENLASKFDSTRTYSFLDQGMYLISARYNADQPMETPSNDFTGLNYGAIVYKKTAYVMHYLKNYLGEEQFDACMHAYFEQWAFKHPQPEDVERVFEETSGENLDWFFKDIVQTKDKVDYKIQKIKKTDGEKYEITIKNVGEIASPVVVQSVDKNNMSINDEIWITGLGIGESRTIELVAEKGNWIQIDSKEIMPEINRQNNQAKTKGLLKRVEPLAIRTGTALDQGDKTQLFLMPLYAWNAYDKNMLGLNIHNSVIPGRNFEYSISPLYSFVTKDINGFANFNYYRPKTSFELSAQSFSEYNNNLFHQQYYKISGAVSSSWKKHPRDRKKNSLKFQSNFIAQDLSLKDDAIGPDPGSEYYFVNSARYGWDYENTRNGYNFKLIGKQIIQDWGNVLYPISAQFDYTLKTKGGKEKFFVRAFVGKFIEFSNTSKFRWNSGGQVGLTNYEYDNLFLGRTETDGFLSKQTVNNQGGLKKPFGVSGNDWIVSSMFAYKPLKSFPIQLFAGASYSDIRPDQNIEGDVSNIWDMDYSAGIAFETSFFSINFPLLYPELFRDANPIKIGQAINFELRIDMAKPFKLIRANIN